ncbi:MAG: 3-keto-5-aminohexanoate cleavage protein [Chloroflexota bacterium]
MIKAAINGMRNSDFHPRLPFNAEQAATESQRSIAAGAEAIHVHVWHTNGAESLHPVDVTRFLNAVRAKCPDIPVGLSTGEWIVPNLAERLQMIEAWDVTPDFVSLNLHEDGFEEVARTLWQKGVAIEAGLFDFAAAEKFSRWSERESCIRILLEPNETTVEAATATVAAIESILDTTAPTIPRLLHGLDATTWPMVRLAAKREYDTRIGFEDTATLPGGRMAQSNEELVRAAIIEMSKDE